MGDIIQIANKIKEHGGRVYLVGGAVRDELLGKKAYDEDYAVVGLTNKEFESLFPQAILRGKSFGVYDIEHKEFALARKEKKIGKGHKSFSVETGKDISILEDLKRGDITINSIAKDVLTHEIIDPFGGIKDIKEKKIRATSEAFLEDPLRVYRVARFAATLNFEVERETLDKMNRLKQELNTLSKERIFEEFKKSLMANKPSIFFEVLRKANVLDIHFREIYDLIGSLQPEKFHPEGDSYNHTMIALDRCAVLSKDIVVRFCTLVHDLGKGSTPKEMMPHHYGHEIRGVALVKKLGGRIGVPNLWIKSGMIVAKEHMKGGIFSKMTPKKQLEFIEKVYHSPIGLEGMKIVVMSDRYRIGEVEENVYFDKLGKDCFQKITGKYIKKKYNIPEDKMFGRKLHEERINWIKNNSKAYKNN